MKSPKKTILIIGASGFVGQALYKYLNQNFLEKYQITGTYYSASYADILQKLDITSHEDLEKVILEIKPDYILLVAGNKNVQDCEDDFSRAYALNTKPVESLITIISQLKLSTRLIYLSTDYVFDGESGNYKDIDEPNPITNYGKTKFMSEQLLLHSDIDFKIIRTAALIGKGGIFFDWLINKLDHEKNVAMYDNVFFSPTPLTFFTEMVTFIIENYDLIPQKILHVVGEKRLNRYQFAKIVKNILQSEVTIYAEKNQNINNIFQHDLSLIPSNIINIRRKRNFEDYLSDEVMHVADYK